MGKNRQGAGEAEFISMAESYYEQWEELQGLPAEFSWDDKTAGAQLLMWEVTSQGTKFTRSI